MRDRGEKEEEYGTIYIEVATAFATIFGGDWHGDRTIRIDKIFVGNSFGSVMR